MPRHAFGRTALAIAAALMCATLVRGAPAPTALDDEGQHPSGAGTA